MSASPSWPPTRKLEPAEALKGVDFVFPPPQPVADWPLPGGDAEQTVGNAMAERRLRDAWRRGIGEQSKAGCAQVTALPVAAGGKVYVMDAMANVSKATWTGAEVWKVNMRPSDNKRDREGFGGGLAYADGKIYMTSGFRMVAQIDATSGKVGWRSRTEQPVHGAPTVVGGRVFAVALDNTLPPMTPAPVRRAGPIRRCRSRPASCAPPALRCRATRWWRPSARVSWWRYAPPTATTCGTRPCRAPAAPVR